MSADQEPLGEALELRILRYALTAGFPTQTQLHDELGEYPSDVMHSLCAQGFLQRKSIAHGLGWVYPITPAGRTYLDNLDRGEG